MIKISKKSNDFINKYVLPNIEYDEINNDNIDEIVDFIIDNFEVPLAQAKEAGETIDEALLIEATNVVTEITSSSDW